MAAGLADEIKQRVGADVELIKSRGGAFEIRRDGELVFSKLSLGRFPEEGEVATLLG